MSDTPVSTEGAQPAAGTGDDGAGVAVAAAEEQNQNGSQNSDAGQGDPAAQSSSPDDGSAAPDGGAADAGEGSHVAPETYADFNLPEGQSLDSVALESALPLMKEADLSQEQAQKLVDWYAGRVQAAEQGQADTYNQMMSDWQEQSKNDSEFGGDKFEESIKTARAAVDRFGTPELKQLLEDHGVGNHPEVIRFMVKVGNLTKEDVPGASASPSNPAKDRVDVLYPKKTS